MPIKTYGSQKKVTKKAINQKDLCEVFGLAPSEFIEESRIAWELEWCPFVDKKCTKTDHEKMIVGVCSVRMTDGKEVIICPKRLYAEEFLVLRQVAEDAFGEIPFLLLSHFDNLATDGTLPEEFVIAYGQLSGQEVQLQVGKDKKDKLSFDWILIRIVGTEAKEIVGVEVQSMDITNNYMETWKAYKEYFSDPTVEIPKPSNGINWANVHKRIIPQIIRKGRVFATSELATKGMYFVVPEIVYQKFESVIGNIEPEKETGRGILNVFTYSLANDTLDGKLRKIKRERIIRVPVDDFALSFIRWCPEANLDEAINERVRKLFLR